MRESRTAAFFCLLVWSCPAWSALTPEVENGSLTGTAQQDAAPPGWVKANSTPDIADENGPSNNTGVPWAPSPDGHTFARLNGTSDPIFREAIAQDVAGFVAGTPYRLQFHVTNLGFYYALTDEWRDREGFVRVYADDISIGISRFLSAPATPSDPIVWQTQVLDFVAPDSVVTLRFEAFTQDPDGNTAYMGVDGVTFVSEDCDNGIDDDLDGLIDANDPDCQNRDGEDLKVRCMHRPVMPQLGDAVTITAQAINERAEAIVVNSVRVYLNDIDTPVAAAVDSSQASHSFIASDETFSYGCAAERATVPFPETADSWRADEPVLRTVDVGTVERPALNAVPIILNGATQQKIDVVFFPDNDEYTSFQDPAFLDHVHDLIDEGFFQIPWFVEFQWAFNFWIGMDSTANATALPPPPGIPPADNPLCSRTGPNNFETRYIFADVAAIVHTSRCRDNAGSPGTFTIEYEADRLQVIAHEAGHRPFGMADEYCCDGGYFSSRRPFLSSDYNPPYPNMFKSEGKCRDAALDRGYDPDACRDIVDADTDEDWWLWEPNYRSEPDRAQRVRDLMQQTGAIEPVEGEFTDRYDAGDSEVDRMGWFLSECVNGRC